MEWTYNFLIPVYVCHRVPLNKTRFVSHHLKLCTVLRVVYKTHVLHIMYQCDLLVSTLRSTRVRHLCAVRDSQSLQVYQRNYLKHNIHYVENIIHTLWNGPIVFLPQYTAREHRA